MFSIETNIFAAVFVCFAPLLLGIRFFWAKPPWWLIVALIAIVGWAAYLLAVLSHFEQLWDVINSTNNPDPELIEQAASDGGPMVFAAFFGWLIALAYAIPWLVLFLLAALLRRLGRRLLRP